MLDKLIRYSHGFVAVPVIRAFDQHGVFAKLRDAGCTRESLTATFRGNTGHFAAALDLLVSLGWIADESDGTLNLLSAARPDAVADILLRAYDCTWSPPDADACELLNHVAPLIARQWHAAEELSDQLSGVLALPLINSTARTHLREENASGSLHDCFVALGWTAPSGRLTPLGEFVAERGLVTGTAASYAPLLRALPELLFGDPQAVMRRDDLGMERHVDRTANVLSSGFQHGRYFADLEAVLTGLLDAPDLNAQPAALVDMGCGDGTLLRRAWDVAQHSLRGRHLDTHPLLLIGVDFNAESLTATGATLNGLPHLLLQGDIADPVRLVADLAARGIDPGRVLHLRSFLDHDRPAALPQEDWSARSADGDACIVVASDGSLVPPAQAMQSLVEHMARWRDALGSHGLLLLEVHRLPAFVVAPCRDDTESPHFDAYHAFSGQQLVQADSFLLAAAEAGLFGEAAAFRKYPRVHPFARIQLQHLRPLPWRLRPARPADLPALVDLEAVCWPDPALRHSAATLRTRLARPRGILLAEQQQGVILGALHVQRIASLDALRAARWDSLHDLHRPDGAVLQLLGLMVRPETQDRGLGDALADFALQWAALTPGVEAVAGLTRCRDWNGMGDYAAWTAARDADGLPVDATLRFHLGRGATLVQLVPGFRPADTANAGHGVLIAYEIGGARANGPQAAKPDASQVETHVADCIRAVMRGGADRFDPTRALRDLGLDSADLLELRTLLNRRLGLRLEASFFFEYPTAARITAALAHTPLAHTPLAHTPLAHTPLAHTPLAHTPLAHTPLAQTRLVRPPLTQSPLAQSSLAQSTPSASRPLPGSPPASAPVSHRQPAPRRMVAPDMPATRATDIAIIGLACRFPGAPDADAFWRLLDTGGDATGPVPADRWTASASDRGGFLDGIADFDPGAFAISAREARSMDPQQRLLLEATLAALEHAGVDPDTLRGTLTGVFLGLFAQDWERRLLACGSRPDGHFATGTSNAIAAGRLAYAFGLCGPALAVNTACSSSLVAVHLAAQSLRQSESTLALAGGVSLLLMPDLTQAFGDAGMLAADGRCRPFDAAAGGYARSEGVGLVVLKRLDQALAARDRVLAVLRGSAVNQDGASNGLTAPSSTAQRAVITAALADAGLVPADIDAVEAHGTGTPLGDPVEAAALAEAYGAGRSAPLLVTAAKGNIGHAEAAAGIAGLIKCVLALRAGRVPGIAHLRAPNPAVMPLLNGTLRLAAGSEAWPGPGGRPRRMGVSAFGFSGTNVHATLEEAPSQDLHAAGPAVMPLAARDAAGLRRMATAWAARLDDAADPVALCAAASRRRMLPVRAAVTGHNVAELRARLAALTTDAAVTSGTGEPRIGFLFTGQGSQYAGMGLALAAREPRFRATLDRADAILRPLLGRPIDALLMADDLAETGNVQPAICVVQLALLELLAAWGVRPAAVIGHSVGEIAAAHAAGVLSFEGALRLAAMRGRIMQALPAGGAMLALRADAPTAERLVAGLAAAGIAALNGPLATVVSGTAEAMAEVAMRAAAGGISAVPLRVSHAFHSPLMEPALGPFAAALEDVAFQPARLPVHSTLTGNAAADLSDPEYWVRQLRAPVRFAQALAGLRADMLLELGPQPVLSGMARACGAAPCQPTLTPDGDALAEALAALHRGGATLDWRAIHGSGHPGADLPPTPLERHRFWVDLPAAASGVQAPVLEEYAPGSPSHGVLGQRMALPGGREARWECRLTAATAPFFQDHRLHGRVVVPAASHIAVVLTGLARLGRPTALTDLVFAEPLILPDIGGRVAQLVLGSETARLVTTPDGADQDLPWATHLEGRPDAADPVPVALPVLKDAISIDGRDFYEGFTAAGYTFGPAMRGLRTAQVDGDTAAGSLAEPQPTDLIIDPALLDAALQLQGVWFDAPALAREGALFVPYSVEHITLYAAPRGLCRAIVRRRRDEERDPATRIADVWLLDASGKVALAARRFRFRRVAHVALLETTARSMQTTARLLHRLDWQPVQAPPATAPSALLENLSLPPAAIAGNTLDEAAAGWTAAAFTAAGTPLTLDEPLDEAAAMRRLGALPARAALIADMLAALRTVGALGGGAPSGGAPGGDGTVKRLPRPPEPAPSDPAAALLARTGPSLLAIAQGRIDPLTLLFPDGDAAPVARLYAEAPAFAAMNRLAADAVAPLARSGLRVIEFGGGTGATTAAVLPALPGCEYHFTDVSAGFAAATAARFPGLLSGILDLEREAGPQDGQRFDLAIVANVLHALRDLPAALRRIAALLRPGGTLLLLEGSAQRSWVNLTFGLLDGWRRHMEGPSPRPQTLLDAAGWDQALRVAGFEPALLASPDAGLFPQTLVAARRVVPARWLVAGLGPLAASVARSGAERLEAASPDATADAVLVCAGEEEPAVAALATLQHLASQSRPPGPVWLITQGAVAAAPDDAVPAPEQAALWGLGRVVRLEHPELDLRLLDLQDPAQLTAFLQDPGAEREVALRGTRRLAARVVQDAAPLAEIAWCPAADEPWLITGGFGGLGLRLAERLAERGARHLVLAGRHSPGDPATLDAIRRHGAQVEAVQLDVTDPAALAVLITRVQPKGVFHLAGVLEDAALLRLDTAALRRAMAPKAMAALLLDRLLQRGETLVLFGSATALIGNPGQAAHAAGNAVLAAVAAFRRARGQPALCVDWGAWGEIGTVAARNPFRGLRPMPPEACLDALWHLLGAGIAHAGVMDVVWEELAGRHPRRLAAATTVFDPAALPPAARRPSMTAHVIGHLCAVLAIPPGQAVDPHLGFFAMGLDSLTSVELRNRLQTSLGCSLPATLTFDHPNIEELVTCLLNEQPAAGDPADGMSDEEALALIEQEAARLGLPEAAE